MEKKLVGNIIGKRFHLVETRHFQFVPVEQKNLPARSQEKHALFAGILHFEVSDGIVLIGKCKTLVASVQRVIVSQSMISFLKPYLVIFIVEYDSAIFLGNGKREFG